MRGGEASGAGFGFLEDKTEKHGPEKAKAVVELKGGLDPCHKREVQNYRTDSTA